MGRPCMQLKTALGALTCTLFLTACAGTSDTLARLKPSLPYPFGAEILTEERFPGSVVCGQYMSYESDGIVRRTRDYVIGPDLVLHKPHEDEVLIYCNRDPQQALYLRLGVGAPSGDWKPLEKVAADMQALRQGIDDYYDDRFSLPVSLAELVASSETLSDDRLVDPWGNAYLYDGGLAGRTRPNPELSTLGADGKTGGRGLDADITLQELPLLSHIIRLRGAR